MVRKIALFCLAAALILLSVNCEAPGGFRLVAWGNIAQNGTIRGSSGNFTVSHTGGTNTYTITWTDATATNALNSIIQVQPGGSFNLVGSYATTVNDDLVVFLFVADTGGGAEAPFNFLVYQW